MKRRWVLRFLQTGSDGWFQLPVREPRPSIKTRTGPETSRGFGRWMRQQSCPPRLADRAFPSRDCAWWQMKRSHVVRAPLHFAQEIQASSQGIENFDR
jgi:hypothetical protein